MGLFDNLNPNYRKLNKLIKNNDIAGIVSFIKSVEDDENKYILENLIGDTFDLTFERFLKIFNEQGSINYNLNDVYVNSSLVFNSKIKNAMIKIDPNWETHFSELQKNYIKFSLKNPIYDELLHSIAFENVEYHLDKYFANNELTPAFYNDIFSFYLNNENGKTVLKDPNLSKNCSPLEIKLLKLPPDLLEEYGDFLTAKFYQNSSNPPKREDLSKYFDGQKFTPEYYKEVLFLPELCNQMAEKINKVKNNYSAIQIAFIKKFSNNPEAIESFSKNNISADVLDKMLTLENSEIQLTKESFKMFFDERKWSILEEFNTEDNKLSTFGLTDAEIKIFKFYKNIKLKNKESLLKILKEKPEIFTLETQELDSFINIFNMMSKKLEESNAPELNKFEGDIIVQLLSSKNPERALELINDVYSKNNLPDVGKAYLVFKILHPNYESFDLEESLCSPMLKGAKNDVQRDIMIFSDLIKCSMGSNNLSVRNYLINIKEGNDLFNKISSGELSLSALSEEQKQILKIFAEHLNTLYNNSNNGKENPRKLTGKIEEDLKELIPLFSATDRYDLPDRIVRMFGYAAGLKSYEIAMQYLDARKKYGDEKGRKNAKNVAQNGLRLEEGDFIKGLGTAGIENFGTILQNGSVAKEFLCAGAKSDTTPLDTDLSRILKNKENLDQAIASTISAAYGPVWFVIKNDSRLLVTRDANGERSESDINRLEVFRTSRDDHYGIRTGFSTSDVDYIVVDKDYDDLNDIDASKINKEKLIPNIKHNIVLNGFYIPVIDRKTGNLIFTPEEYDELRSKMSGLKRYNAGEFKFSSNLNFDPEIQNIKNTFEETNKDIKTKKEKITEIVKKVLENNGLEFKSTFDSDITVGSAQLIDTGSTGRGTSIGKTSDFDFILRLDGITSKTKIRDELAAAIGGDVADMANLRCKNVKLDGINETADIEISFVKKADSNFLSTDAALKERLEQIKKQDSDKYNDVIANIILAKKVLKEAEAYKPAHSPIKEGGLGGVGVENWILQYGGSFIDAAEDFVKKAENKNFEEFEAEYEIWDYGKNFYTGDYDEFVSENMTKKGYNKMVNALKNYLAKINNQAKSTNQNKFSFTNSNVNSDISEYANYEEYPPKGR